MKDPYLLKLLSSGFVYPGFSISLILPLSRGSSLFEEAVKLLWSKFLVWDFHVSFLGLFQACSADHSWETLLSLDSGSLHGSPEPKACPRWPALPRSKGHDWHSGQLPAALRGRWTEGILRAARGHGNSVVRASEIKLTFRIGGEIDFGTSGVFGLERVPRVETWAGYWDALILVILGLLQKCLFLPR